jgi:peptidoglycan/xylan/chitin deacetylase (PgdA/CDA1 family)
VFVPQSQLFLPIISRGSAASPGRVALTFDDGPGPGTAPILDALGAIDVKAAFFVIGANVLRHPDLVRRMDAEGHIVANHTFDHARLGAARSPHYWQGQLRQADEAIEQVIGKRPTLFRPPLGIKSWRMASPLRERGLTTVCWSLRGLDGVKTTTDRILKRLVAPAAAGDILLLHDGHEPDRPRDQSATVEAIRPLVNRVRERGLEFERLDRLIGREAYLATVSEAR